MCISSLLKKFDVCLATHCCLSLPVLGHPEAPKPPPAPLGPRRKRVKKLVTKTHINDAGEFGESVVHCLKSASETYPDHTFTNSPR